MRRTMKCAAAIALASILSGWTAVVLAGGFELEPLSGANIKDDVGGADPTDWSALFDVPANELDNNFTNDSDSVRPTPKTTLPAGVLRAAFFRDFLINSTTDATAFTTGSKDIYNISGNGALSGQWQCKKVSNISDKGDALNAYAAIQNNNGNIMLVMGVERATDTGTSKVGFWFLQDRTVNCVATSGSAVTFTGNHVDGDLLVVINFSQGGNNPTPVLYRWTGNATTGGLVLVPTGGGECTVGTTNDCATTNRDNSILHTGGGVPWLTQGKTSGGGFSHDLAPLRFFEAQVNLTSHNLQRCFNRFMANSRQSDTTSSTMFDYVIGDFDVCGFTATKSCTAGSVTNGTDVNYSYKVNVANTGIGTLNHVSVTEQATSCSVTSSNDETIAAGANKDFTVACSDVGVDHTNTAQVNAKDDDGNSLAPVTVTAKSADAGACALTLTSDITMDSACDGVVLESTGSRLGLEATIGMTVHAPSTANTEALNNVKIDVYDKTCNGEVSACTKLQTIDVASQLKFGDADVKKTHTYDVALGDNTATSQCAANAIFQRRVVAHGVGAITGNSYFSSLLNGTPVALPVDCKPCINCSDSSEE